MKNFLDLRMKCYTNAYHKVKWNTIECLIKLKLVQTKQIMINPNIDIMKTTGSNILSRSHCTNYYQHCSLKMKCSNRFALYIIFYFQYGWKKSSSGKKAKSHRKSFVIAEWNSKLLIVLPINYMYKWIGWFSLITRKFWEHIKIW